MTIKAQTDSSVSSTEVAVILTTAEVTELLLAVYAEATNRGVPPDRILTEAPPTRAAAIRKLQAVLQ